MNDPVFPPSTKKKRSVVADVELLSSRDSKTYWTERSHKIQLLKLKGVKILRLLITVKLSY